MPIIDRLDRSRATDDFRAAVRDFLRSGQPNERLAFDLRSPAVKVERTLTQLFEMHPELAIERVEIDARSGCEFFRGTATVLAADDVELSIDFEWDCRWKAEQLGWTDFFGLPDQIRAARELGHACFRRWDVQPTGVEAS
jgi:hypothetical protein